MSSADPDVRATPVPSGDLRVAQGQATRALILAAASDLLREEGYAATSTRAVAERAGARLSLVHYHFGSKRSLLLAVLEDLSERLLHRQQAMFNDGRSFAEQWRSACDYLRDDVDSGYVRRLFDEHRSGRASHGQALWNVWMLARWMERTAAQDAVAAAVPVSVVAGGR